jgi:hypothetical protein
MNLITKETATFVLSGLTEALFTRDLQKQFKQHLAEKLDVDVSAIYLSVNPTLLLRRLTQKDSIIVTYTVTSRKGSLDGLLTKTEGAVSDFGWAASKIIREQQTISSGLCPLGTYSNEGIGACLGCRAGTYSSSYGSATCADCPQQYFTDQSGQAACRPCPAGKYQNNEGATYCTSVRDRYLLHSTANTTALTQRACPSSIACEDNEKKYPGKMWHRPRHCTKKSTQIECARSAEVLPVNGSTALYICVTDGCPDSGNSTMTCKEGYVQWPDAPACAVCSEGFFKQLNKCVLCEKPNIAGAVGMALGFIVLAGVAIRFIIRYQRFIKRSGVYGHLKIFASFFTILGTIETQVVRNNTIPIDFH